MKTSLFFISFLILCLPLWGQIEIYSKSDTDSSLKLVNEYYFKGDYDSSIYILEQFDTTHRLYNEICIFKCELYWEKRYYEKLIQQTEDIFSQIDKSSELYSRLLYRYGLALQNVNEYEKAIEVFTEGFKITKESYYAFANLNSLNTLNRFENVIALENSYENYINTNFGDFSTYIFEQYGIAYFYLGNLDKSEYYFRKSNMLEEKGNSSYYKFETLLYMSKIYENRNNKSVAKKYVKKAKRLYNENYSFFHIYPGFPKLEKMLEEELKGEK